MDILIIVVAIAVVYFIYTNLEKKDRRRRYKEYMKDMYPDPWSDDPEERKRAEYMDELFKPGEKRHRDFKDM